jgi:heme/copper-type cytochrome/quinol oxidase subunit 3
MNMAADTHPMSRVSTGKVALFVILGSESVFFATLLVAYAALRDQSNWPMQHNLTRLAFPIINTLILLISAIPAWRAITSIRKDNKSASQILQILTLTLGLIFVAGQVYEFGHADLHINDQAFGGVFFTLMGFHALHVLAGIAFIVINIFRTQLGDFTARYFDPIELGTWFWYYVLAVWIILFISLYLI